MCYQTKPHITKLSLELYEQMYSDYIKHAPYEQQSKADFNQYLTQLYGSWEIKS